MRRNLEMLECFKVIQWRDANKYLWPELGLLIHVPNEGRRSPRGGIIAQRMGLTRGVPDFLLISRMLGIEMKTLEGKQSKEQVAFGELMISNGAKYYVCYNAQDAVRIIKDEIGI